MINKRKMSMLIKSLRGEAGATLVEELVTIAIIGMGIVVLVAMITTGALGVRQVDDNVRADSLARSQLELIKDAPYEADPISSPYPSVAAIPGYTVTVGVEYWNSIAGDFQLASPDEGLQKITVTVTAGSSQTAQISDFKVDR